MTEAALSLVTQLAKKAAWLPDDSVQDFAHAVPQVSSQLCQPEARMANQLTYPDALELSSYALLLFWLDNELSNSHAMHAGGFG